MTNFANEASSQRFQMTAPNRDGVQEHVVWVLCLCWPRRFSRDSWGSLPSRVSFEVQRSGRDPSEPLIIGNAYLAPRLFSGDLLSYTLPLAAPPQSIITKPPALPLQVLLVGDSDEIVSAVVVVVALSTCFCVEFSVRSSVVLLIVGFC